jgi:type I site-specific restriction-modification system R (restriction) subunit
MPKLGEACYPLLINCKNIVVVPDEAHGSYYSFHAVLEKETRHFRFGYAKHKRDTLQVAIFVGFTGKPIESYDRNTRAVFGDYVSICDIRDAVMDGATMPSFTKVIWQSSILTEWKLQNSILKLENCLKMWNTLHFTKRLRVDGQY